MSDISDKEQTRKKPRIKKDTGAAISICSDAFKSFAI